MVYKYYLSFVWDDPKSTYKYYCLPDVFYIDYLNFLRKAYWLREKKVLRKRLKEEALSGK